MSVAPSSTKQEIIASLFSKRSPEDGSLEEQYISHVKIWEDDEQGRKPRFLMLAAARSGRCFIHKAKRNSNMTFSKGKTWNLEDVRLIEVQDPLHFALTMSKTYRWETEREREQAIFLEAVVKTYRGWVGKSPKTVGFTPAPSSDRRPSSGAESLPAPSYPNPTRRPSHDSQVSDAYGGMSDSGSQYGGSQSQYSNSPYNGPSALPARPRPPITSSRSPAASYSGSESGGPSRNAATPTSRSAMSNAPTTRESEPSRGGQAGSGRRSGDEPRKLSAESRSHSNDSNSSTQGGSRNVSGAGHRAPAQPSPLNQVASPKPSAPVPLRSTTPTSSSTRQNPTPKISVTIPSAPPPPQSKPSLDAVSSPTIRVSPSPSIGRPTESPIAAAPSPLRSSSPKIPQPPLPPPVAPSNSTNGPSIPKSGSSSSLLAPSPSASSLAPPPSNGTAPSPSASAPKTASPSTSRAHRKLSLLPPPLQTSFSRDLLLADDPLTPAGHDEGEDVILANVEEMLEGWDWSALTLQGGAGKGSSSVLKEGGKGEMERRLADELGALEAANIHSFLEADERVALVLEHIDRAILQLDETDAKILSFKMQLNAVSDDISYIESQNRGLQVQTSNQKALLAELENLLQIVNVDKQDLLILTQESLESDRGIQSLENAAASLYKALQAGRDTAVGDMAAAIERMTEYQTHNAQFTKRISDYLFIMFKFQSEMLLADKDSKGVNPVIKDHLSMETKLEKYAGLILYMRELDEDRYQKLCAAYFGVTSDLHKKEMKDTLMAYIAKVKKTIEEESAESFVTGGSSNQAPKGSGALARSKTMAALRSPMDTGRKDKKSDSDMKASEAFERAVTQIVNMVYREETFISNFLHINAEEATFADYMGLEPYFRRQATRFAANGMGPGARQIVRSAMDLIFGFLAPEMTAWVDGALQRDPMQIVGIMAACERFLTDAEERNIEFVIRVFQKQLQRLTVTLDRFIASQVKSIEGTKITIKKRKGVAPFVKHFPVFIDRFESQLVGTDGLEIRSTVDASYEKIANAMFESLQQLAKMDGAEGLAPEDKGQLNYHVILIENMHFFVAEMSQQNPATFEVLLARAQGIYRENMDSYVRLVVRKPLAKMIDFVEGAERIIATSSANDVPTNPQYSKVVLKRVVKEHDAKDMRKTIEALHKRIHKHFDQSSTMDAPSQASSTELIEVVAGEAQGELCSFVDRLSVLISRCFPDAGLALDFSTNDVAAAFKRAKAGL